MAPEYSKVGAVGPKPSERYQMTPKTFGRLLIVYAAVEELQIKVCPEIVKSGVDVEKYDAIYIGTPVWDGTIAPPMRSYLRDTLIKTPNVAAFACMAGKDPKKTFDVIKELVVIDDLVAEVSFYNPASGNDPDTDSKIEQLAGCFIKEIPVPESTLLT